MISPACKGCKYRSQDKTFPCCDYYTLTGKLRGCPPGELCTRRIVGDRTRQSWNQLGAKPKRILLTEEEKRKRRNALKRAERAKKKTAISLQTERGAVEK